MILWFFISSYSLCIDIILSFFSRSSFNRCASCYCFICFYAFWAMMFDLVYYLFSSLIRSLSSSSASRYCLTASLWALSYSFLCLIFITCSAFFLVSSIFFQAFFSSSFKRAIRLARSLASSAAFFLFWRVATRAPVISSGSS